MASTLLGFKVSWASDPPPRLLRLPGAGESAGATSALGRVAEGMRTLPWVRDPEGSLRGPEGPHFRGEEEP